MLTKEYRICMPLSVEEYHIGQLYMIAKHSAEESGDGEGVEVVANRPHEDPVHGKGQFTEKRMYGSKRLPSWVRSLIPRACYVTEKAWNYYPYTITEYTCSFLPSFSISIKTRYENNPGTSENVNNLPADVLENLEVDHVDILTDEVQPHHYKECEDLKFFKSKKTGRGPLKEGWKKESDPIMCSYKTIQIKAEVWMLQSRLEDYAHKMIREVLLVAHRQAVAWIDEWHGMTIEDVREYEERMQAETNLRLRTDINITRSVSVDPAAAHNAMADEVDALEKRETDSVPRTAETAQAPKKGWFW